MQLYVMRHGDAIRVAPTDADRPLSPLGEHQALTMVESMLEAPPERLLASPYLRAQQTARIVQRGLSEHGITLSIETVDYITPDDSPSDVVRLLSQYNDECILMVSHQPLVGCLVTLLSEGHTMGAPMLTASIANLTMDQIGVGMATLEWIKTP